MGNAIGRSPVDESSGPMVPDLLLDFCFGFSYGASDSEGVGEGLPFDSGDESAAIA